MMGLLNRIRLTALAIGMLVAPAGLASANFTYNINLSVPNQSGLGSGVGTDSATGTITVDKLGALAATDFVAYSLTFTDPLGDTSFLTQSSGNVVIAGGATVNASAMSLTVTLPAPAAGNAYFIINSGGAPNLYYDSVSTSTYLVINPPASLGSETLSTTGGTFIVGTAAAVPEPSSLVLMGIGGITGLGYARRRRLAKVVA